MYPLLQDCTVTCPVCFERITVPVEADSPGVQVFTHDCEVCCRPMRVTVTVVSAEDVSIEVEAE